MLISYVPKSFEILTVERWNIKHKECWKLFARFIMTAEFLSNMLTDILEFSSISWGVSKQFENGLKK